MKIDLKCLKKKKTFSLPPFSLLPRHYKMGLSLFVFKSHMFRASLKRSGRRSQSLSSETRGVGTEGADGKILGKFLVTGPSLFQPEMFPLVPITTAVRSLSRRTRWVHYPRSPQQWVPDPGL